MRIRIGLDDTAAEVSIGTATRSRIALLGPPGCGKTTTCRYVARHWIAARVGPCLLATPRPYEYGDLGVVIADAGRVTDPDRPGLLIVDDADLGDARTVEWAVRSGHQPVIVCSLGPAIADLAEGGTPAFDVAYSLDRTPRIVSTPVQCRLDWPADTVPVFLDRRGYGDFPLHRWAM